MKIEHIITHKNLDKYLDALLQEPYFQPGPVPKLTGKEWFHQEVVLEFPLGELAKDWLTHIALVGIRPKPEAMPLTGKEGFSAQGLEGKIQIKKPLVNALFNMRDILPPNRGRIITSTHSHIE